MTDATDRFSLFELIGLDLDQASASIMFLLGKKCCEKAMSRYAV
jgi:hypothetical protein